MGIIPRPVVEYVLTNQGIQIQMGYQPRSREQVWNKYDCVAARIAAPIWLFIWIMTVGKMGRGLWYWKEINRSQGLPPGVADTIANARSVREIAVANVKAALDARLTYTADGDHFLVGESRPLADDADMRPDGRILRAEEKARAVAALKHAFNGPD